MKKTTKFRKLINRKGIIVSVGAYDALSAVIAQKVGFKAITVGGYGISASLLGKPDIGLVSMSEMVSQINYIANSTDLPIIADADNGYGNAINVMRTVREYEKIGVSAILLEDQDMPKKCGHMKGKRLISVEEHQKKIAAAIKARKDPDLVIIARTDSRAVYGINDAIERSKAYLEAGADMIFVEAPTSREELELIAKRIDAPLVANMIESGKTPFYSAQELETMGYKLVFYTLGVFYSVAKTLLDFMSNLKEKGTTKDYWDKMLTFDDFNNLVGLSDIKKLEREYLI